MDNPKFDYFSSLLGRGNFLAIGECAIRRPDRKLTMFGAVHALRRHAVWETQLENWVRE